MLLVGLRGFSIFSVNIIGLVEAKEDQGTPYIKCSAIEEERCEEPPLEQLALGHIRNKRTEGACILNPWFLEFYLLNIRETCALR